MFGYTDQHICNVLYISYSVLVIILFLEPIVMLLQGKCLELPQDRMSMARELVFTVCIYYILKEKKKITEHPTGF